MNIYPPRVLHRTPSLQLLLVPGSWLLVFFLTCFRLHGQTCNDLSVIALDADCSVAITPDMVLEGTYTDSLYVVSLTTLAGLPLGSIVTAAQLGDTLRATVTNTLSDNSCWGLVVVEDHLPPLIACTHLSLPCVLPQYTPAYLASLGLTAAFPAITENCGAYNFAYTDTWVNLDCNDPNDRGAYIERVWTAADGSGNKSTCTQYLNIRRVHAGQLNFPADTTVSCSNPLTDPAHSGQPYYNVFGVPFPVYPDRPLCGLKIAYTDQILPLCGGAYTILRTWTVFDDCLPTTPVPPFLNPLLHVQVISVADKQGPAFVCPKDTVVSTDPFVPCSGSFDLPDVVLSDNCSKITFIRADWEVDGIPFKLAGTLADFSGNNWWNPDTLGVLGMAENLPSGVTTIRYTVGDDCGNLTSCTFRVTVSDGVPPFVACDEFTQVGLGINGMALVNAATFDDGSLDNCSRVYFKARRVAPNTCQPNDRFYDKVKFCCADAGDTVAVLLRVYDIPVDTGALSLEEAGAHASECLVYVLVEDKIKPVCTPPLNMTISCVNFDPSLVGHGTASFADNCCLDTVWEMPPNYSLFDTMCNRGTLVRTFRAADCNGGIAQCTQRLVVTYQQDYAIRMPDDILAYDCDTMGIYGPGPKIFGKACELIAISFEDNVSTGGVQSCYRIEREWKIINWCNYNPNVPLIEVPNPNPSADPQDLQNLPGPVVAPAGHNPPATVMRISPDDPAPTDYSIFWAPDSYGYRYRQIISVLDNVPPKVRGCPMLDGPVEFCDLTDNDPQFWHENYWISPTIPGSTDLCEGITDLAVTASDGCSKGNVNIRYLLFLDLDGDGTTESVINSINPPPVNTVLYNNAMTPNFAGGEPRAFDERPVPADEKYRFTIQSSGFVNKTAWVRWATEKDPDKYIIPQLPHGLHRIMWIINDGCGNETICEYPILVRDCRKPDLVCLNGISVDIQQTKSITLWASDFLLYTNDNCTPPGQIRLGIRKSGTGLGFPLNPDGSPQTSVTYTCDELGVQPVELWATDAAGNFNMCESFVLVQDNFGVCSATSPGTIAGQIKTAYPSPYGLEGVDVPAYITHPGLPPLYHSDATDHNGFFQILQVPGGASYTVAPRKDNDPLNGVSTFDLVLINKHILGIEPLNSPYKMIAADANNSRSITTFDIIELRKLILGVSDNLPANTSWRFVDKNYQFPNPYNPFQEIFPEVIQRDSLQAGSVSEDFIAVKTGDVNGNAITSSLNAAVQDRRQGTLLFDVLPADRLYYPGDVFSVDFSAAEKVAGYQFTMHFPDLEVLKIQPGEGMRPDHFALFPAEHALTTSFEVPENVKQAQFRVTFRARAAGQLNKRLNISSRITRAEAYRMNVVNAVNVVNVVNVMNEVNEVNVVNVMNEVNEVNVVNAAMTNDAMTTNDVITNAAMTQLDVAFRFKNNDKVTIAPLAFELYQNTPNPWSDKTEIRFYLPEAGEARLTVLDEAGVVRFSQKGEYAKGYHNIALNRSAIIEPGVFFYRLETASGSAIRKMVKL